MYKDPVDSIPLSSGEFARRLRHVSDSLPFFSGLLAAFPRASQQQYQTLAVTVARAIADFKRCSHCWDQTDTASQVGRLKRLETALYGLERSVLGSAAGGGVVSRSVTADRKLSHVFPYYDLRAGALCLADLDQLTLSCKWVIPKSDVMCMLSHWRIGGPTLVRVLETVYIIGGFDGNVASAKCFCVNLPYDFDKSSAQTPLEYTRVADMHVAKYDVAAAAVGRRFVFGVAGSFFREGRDVQAVDSECYDCRNNSWIDIAPLTVPRACPGISAFDDRFIYIYAGQSQGTPQLSRANMIERLDSLEPDAGWRMLAISKDTLLTKTEGAGVVQSSNKEIIIWGERAIHSVWLDKGEISHIGLANGYEIRMLVYPRLVVHRHRAYMWSVPMHDDVLHYDLRVKYGRVLDLRLD